MRRVFWGVAVLAAVLASCKPDQDAAVITLGGLLPLTGESAFWGENIRKGADLALAEINQRGGVLGKELRIVYEDSEGDPAQGTRAFSKLVNVDNVEAVIGDVISSVILAVAPLAERDSVVILGFGESAEITAAGEFIFRNWNSAASDAALTGDYAARNSRRVVVLAQNDAFGRSASTLFKQRLANNGTSVVYEDAFAPDQVDFRSIITKLRNVEYDGLYFGGFHNAALAFFRQYRQFGLPSVPIYGVSSWEEGGLVAFLQANYPDLAVYGYPQPPDSMGSVVRHFRSAYARRYNAQPEILADNGYDAVYMIVKAIEMAGEYSGNEVRQALIQVRYDGASGPNMFDSNGDVNKPFGLKRITGTGPQWMGTP